MQEELVQEKKIRADTNEVFQELLVWGESKWWPKDCLMEFINLSGMHNSTTVYLQRVKLPIPISWHTRNEVVDKDKMLIRRRFLDGKFRGYEELKVERGENISRVVYIFNVEIKNVLFSFMWRLLFRKLHIRNIYNILESLRKYKEKG